MPEIPRTFEEFWLYYLRQHARRETRAFHLAGTALALLLLAAAIFMALPLLVVIGLVAGYGAAWLGHAIFERNRPATFRRPLWSLLADARMFRLWMTGGLGEELRRAGIAA